CNHDDLSDLECSTALVASRNSHFLDNIGNVGNLVLDAHSQALNLVHPLNKSSATTHFDYIGNIHYRYYSASAERLHCHAVAVAPLT
ncbi:hypothetical protein PFISCL1PPCAC_4219, partial [Pristionchus fissidentatus]